MPTLCPLLAYAILVVFQVALATDECIRQCDALYSEGMPITFCGIDGRTYNTTSDAILQGTSSCYLVCGVAAQYQGECGCPNDCQSDVQQGTCVKIEDQQRVCQCSFGWGGRDCSLPTDGNPCGYHGKFISTSSSSHKSGYCECDEGWYGVNCITSRLNIGNAPWGTIYPDTEAYNTKEDKYGDYHPLFNIEVLPTISITMKDDDYLNLIHPSNLFNSTYHSVNITWNNGDDIISLQQVGMKLKGQGSLECMKKGFSLKFNEFIS